MNNSTFLNFLCCNYCYHHLGEGKGRGAQIVSCIAIEG